MDIPCHYSGPQSNPLHEHLTATLGTLDLTTPESDRNWYFASRPSNLVKFTNQPKSYMIYLLIYFEYSIVYRIMLGDMEECYARQHLLQKREKDKTASQLRHAIISISD